MGNFFCCWKIIFLLNSSIVFSVDIGHYRNGSRNFFHTGLYYIVLKAFVIFSLFLLILHKLWCYFVFYIPVSKSLSVWLIVLPVVMVSRGSLSIVSIYTSWRSPILSIILTKNKKYLYLSSFLAINTKIIDHLSSYCTT